jgi:hypothetical protein
MKVRYPADGMAYVFCPQASRDLEGLLGTMTSSAEPYLVGSPRPATVTLITLVLRRGRWLVHAIGPMVAPADLGLKAYSW